MNRRKQKISIENLSNEFFYEIFDYLDGCHIYNAFSNLNIRFQQLLNSPCLRFKIKLKLRGELEERLIKNWNQIIQQHRQQILSLHFSMPSYIEGFFSTFTFDSTLNQLESLNLDTPHLDEFMSVLMKLSHLPQLRSLTIYIYDQEADLNIIYQKVFKLELLKYFKLRSNTLNLPNLLPMSTNQQLTSMEYLIIDHSYTFKHLSTVLSYTPRLHHLSLMRPMDHQVDLEHIPLISLSNLTKLSINLSDITFDQFELLIKQASLKLKSLSIIQCEDIIYLDAQRWEQLILQNFPQLEKFDFKYYNYTDENSNDQIYSKKPNQFTSSSFWIERQWIFEAEISHSYIQYFIKPYQLMKRWYDYPQENILGRSIDLSKSSRLILDYLVDEDEEEDQDIKRVLTIEQIYHLEITEEEFFIGSLIRTLNWLPELDTLKIHSLSLNQPRNLSFEEMLLFCSSEIISKITKVYLYELIDLKDIYFLLTLCPYMIYLEIQTLNGIEFHDCLEHIFKKIHHDKNTSLRYLCFHIPPIDEETMDEFERTFNSKQLLADYTIKRIADNVYLERK